MRNTLNTRAFLTAAAFAVVLSARAAAPATFDIVPRDFPAHLYTIAVGDFNRDGLLDIAGTDQKGNLVSVYLGTVSRAGVQARQGAVGLHWEPDRGTLRVRMARRLRTMVPIFWQRELGVR